MTFFLIITNVYKKKKPNDMNLKDALQRSSPETVAAFLQANPHEVNAFLKSPPLKKNCYYVVVFTPETLLSESPFRLLTTGNVPAEFTDQDEAYEAAYNYAEGILESRGVDVDDDDEALDAEQVLEQAADVSGEYIVVCTVNN
jgi:hypothetical protein